MKKLFIALALGSFVFASNAAWADQVFKLTIDGLACPFCAYGVEKKLKTVEGTKNLEVSINKGEIIMTLEDDATFTKEEAAQLVDDAGFALRNFERVEAAN
jgi:periplasmic mercuric ion binding protein